MLADIPSYNRRIDKTNKIIEKKEKALKRQKKGMENTDSNKLTDAFA
jgi:hypothetical protein